MWVRPLDWEDPLEEDMATHSSILAWRIPRTEEPGGLQSTGSPTVGQDWSDLAHTHIYSPGSESQWTSARERQHPAMRDSASQRCQFSTHLYLCDLGLSVPLFPCASNGEITKIAFGIGLWKAETYNTKDTSHLAPRKGSLKVSWFYNTVFKNEF